jgi:hypothetical protein
MREFKASIHKSHRTDNICNAQISANGEYLPLMYMWLCDQRRELASVSFKRLVTALEVAR